MKKLLLTTALFLSISTFGQDNFFRVDGSIGAAISQGKFKAYGVSAATEPKYFFYPNVSLGLRLEGDALFGGKIDGEGDDVQVGISSRASYTLKGEYYLGGGNTKPFVCIMAGMYTQANIGTNVKGENTAV